MKRKVLATVLAVAMVGASLAGCGGSSSDSSSDSSSSDTEESADASEDSSSSDDASAEDDSSSSDDASEEDESDSSAAEDSSDASTDDTTSTSSSAAADGDLTAGTEFEGLSVDGDYNFQVIVKAYSSAYWSAILDGVNAASKDYGVTVDTQGPNNESDVADQVNMLNTAISNGPDGIGLAACDADSVTDSLKDAESKGVPIVAVDSAIENAPEGSLVATIATNNVDAGAMAADEIWDAIKDEVSSADGQVRVGLVCQDTVSGSQQGRGIGFINEICENASADGVSVGVTGNDYYVGGCDDPGDESSADLVVEVRVPSQITADLCQNEASAMMNKNDTIAIIATGQMSTEAVIAADSNMGVLKSDPSEGMIGMGFDSGTILKQAITDGTLYGCITQSPYGMGYYCVCALIMNANGDSVEDMDVPCYFYTADNIDDPSIAQNLYD